MTEENSSNIPKKRFCQRLIEWNLFKTDDEQQPTVENDNHITQSTINANSQSFIQEQRVSTRVYIILLTGWSNRRHLESYFYLNVYFSFFTHFNHLDIT
jgi:hypothetical protein